MSSGVYNFLCQALRVLLSLLLVHRCCGALSVSCGFCMYFCLLNNASLWFSKFICLLIVFCFFNVLCSLARKAEYNFGRRSIYSTIIIPSHSSYHFTYVCLIVKSVIFEKSY